MVNYADTSHFAVAIRDLHVIRGGRPILDGISLDVSRGAVTGLLAPTGLLGPSGSGKTTLLRSIVGTQIVESGEVRVLGLPAGSPELRHRVAYVTQAPSVYVDLTVRENLRYFARVVGAPASRVDEVIAVVKLDARANQIVRTLSGGERSRASLAAALLGDPELLILDEPTVGLDPLLRRDLWQTFNDLVERGATILVSTHVMDEAERTDDLVLLRDGRIVATGSPEALRERTRARDLEQAFIALSEVGP
jgi:ABC-2 type transport system ATP-binding protein